MATMAAKRPVPSNPPRTAPMGGVKVAPARPGGITMAPRRPAKAPIYPARKRNYSY